MGVHLLLDYIYFSVTVSLKSSQMSSLAKSYRSKSYKVVPVKSSHSIISRQASGVKGSASWYTGNVTIGANSPIRLYLTIYLVLLMPANTQSNTFPARIGDKAGNSSRPEVPR